MRELAARLRERRGEIEQTVLARVYGVSDPEEVDDPDYTLGLRNAVTAALDHAIAALETGHEPAPLPPQLRMQARVAARNGVPLETVLRRYSAGYTLLGDYLIEEAGKGSVPGDELKRALRAQAAVYDRLVAAISEEHSREMERRQRSTGQRRTELVRMLLAGHPVDPAELRYSLDLWHIAAVASGPGAIESLRDFAAALDCQALIVPAEDTAWVWLGGRSKFSAEEIIDRAEQILPRELLLALGEPARGIEGWRLTHRQSRAAMSVAQRGFANRVRYADVALLASALRDDVLASSLRDIYLAPLEGERDGGAALRGTLRAYFEAGRNVSSAAARLGIARQTVSIRLRAFEERIGRSLSSCAAETEVALRLSDLGAPVTTDR
jgi:hypothetical protein